MELFGEVIGLSTAILLLIALALALGFEVVNGFHDTANAVATVIYTNTLPANFAVVWSGIWNLIGVLMSSGAVAFGIVALLPVELVLNIGSAAGIAMVFALLISAIVWNLGTWYLGLPASSSHTLIGSIMGVGLAHSMLSSEVFGEGVNWGKAQEVFLALLVSPLLGFTFAALLVIVMKSVVHNPALYKAPEGKTPPPWWIRGILIFTCTGVSFAHGSNDGQKGMGLMMLILIGIVPATFALNLSSSEADLARLMSTTQAVSAQLGSQRGTTQMTIQEAEVEISNYLKPSVSATAHTTASMYMLTKDIEARLSGKQSLAQVPSADRTKLRSDLYLMDQSIEKMMKQKKLGDGEDKAIYANYRSELAKSTRFIPLWVKISVALALGLGTMVGWKRIVVTVGEKIGKDHLTYAQGAAAELVAMTMIFSADTLGLPVSTTHVLTSGVAGTMAANKSGVQMQTVKSLLLAWVLTLPACILLGAGLFAGGFYAVTTMKLF